MKRLACQAFGKHFNTAVLLALAMGFASSMTLRKLMMAGNSAASPSSFGTAEFLSNFVLRQMSTRVSALTLPRTQLASCEICDSE